MMIVGCIPRECADSFIEKLVSRYRSKIYEYNTLIKSYGVKLKPVHIVVSKNRKYVYLGRYWYRVAYQKGKIKWIYLGRFKPYKDMPDPPINPLDIIVLREECSDMTCIEIPDYLSKSSEILFYMLTLIAELSKMVD